jgi:hypothetical protein
MIQILVQVVIMEIVIPKVNIKFVLFSNLGSAEHTYAKA